MYNSRTMKANRMFGFRSTIEFQWAMVLDYYNIEYIYEPKTFYIESLNTYYLPDFYLPKYETYLEIKVRENDFEKEKIRQLSIKTKKTCILLHGSFPSPQRGYYTCRDGRVDELVLSFPLQELELPHSGSNIGKIRNHAIVAAEKAWDGDLLGFNYAKHFAEYVFSKELDFTKKTRNHLEEQGWVDYLVQTAPVPNRPGKQSKTEDK